MSSILTFSNRSVKLFTLKNRFLITVVVVVVTVLVAMIVVLVVWIVGFCCGAESEQLLSKGEKNAETRRLINKFWMQF